MYQHFPNHLVPSLFDSNLNQSLFDSLLFLTYYKKKENIYISNIMNIPEYYLKLLTYGNSHV